MMGEVFEYSQDFYSELDLRQKKKKSFRSSPERIDLGFNRTYRMAVLQRLSTRHRGFVRSKCNSSSGSSRAPQKAKLATIVIQQR